MFEQFAHFASAFWVRILIVLHNERSRATKRMLTFRDPLQQKQQRFRLQIDPGLRLIVERPI